ncbi:hypothetical protein, partial [Klebsiella pneumoniae]|uniref:hypothetical protein n=1 Tax=Klebsiella pneumoniae TaxID=573 RepID=UPI0019D2A2E8
KVHETQFLSVRTQHKADISIQKNKKTMILCIAYAIRGGCAILVKQMLYKRGVYEIRCSTQPKS